MAMNELAVTRYLLEIRSLALVLTSATAALPIAPDLDVMLRIGMPVCMQRKRRSQQPRQPQAQVISCLS